MGALIVVLHVLLLKAAVAGTSSLLWANSLLWFAATSLAALQCALAARAHAQAARRAWYVLAAACVSWALGQVVWTAAHYLPVLDMPYPGLADFLYFGFVPLTIAGLLTLPKPHATFHFSIRHFGNLALLFCTLLTTMAITLWEPARSSILPRSQILVHAAYCLSVGCVLLVALYLFWSYHWQASWWPLLLLAMGAGVYTVSDIYYLHKLVADSYRADDLVNLSWVITFALVASAANEERWRTRQLLGQASRGWLARERWLEAAMPGMLILTIVVVATLNHRWLSATVLAICAGSAAIFAITLGVREAFIQREEQRLLDALNASHFELRSANQELVVSEQRVRTLNAELEQRVVARTAELSDAYRELESFSYAIAHDLKAPLRAVNGFGSLLLDEYGPQLDDKGRGYAERMRRGALNMAQLVDDLLAYSRVERRESHAQPIDIGALLDGCVADQRDEAQRVGAHITLAVEPVDLVIDGEALGLAVRNLLQNALKFSAASQPPTISIGCKRNGDRLHVSVADNGIGFDMAFHDRIFQLFQRLHRADEYPGTGIGLAIVRKAIERLGGRVWGQSELAHGATFYIEVPLRPRN